MDSKEHRMTEPLEICPWCGMIPKEPLTTQPHDVPICNWCGRPLSQKETD